MQKRSKLEQIVQHLVNEEQDQAKKLFHDYIVERARSIHDELMEEENNVVDQDDDNFDPNSADSEVEFEEMMDDEDVNDESESDEYSDEDSDEYGDEGSDEEISSEEDIEQKIEDLEKELQDLRDELEELEDGEESESSEEDEEVKDSDELEDFNFDDESKTEDDDELQEMEDHTTSEHNANRKLRKTNQYGSHKGDPLETDHELTETGPNAKGNANKVKNSGHSKADPMQTDFEDTGKPKGDQKYDDDGDYAYDEAGWPGKPLTTESDDFDIFDSLDESALDDLETVDVKMGGEQGGGKYAGNENNTESPIPQKEPAKRWRSESESSLTSKQDQHDGFQRENSPNTKHHPKYSNVRDTAASSKHGYDHVEKGTHSKDSKLQSDDGFGELQTDSPIGSKGTAGNKKLKTGKK